MGSTFVNFEVSDPLIVVNLIICVLANISHRLWIVSIVSATLAVETVVTKSYPSVVCQTNPAILMLAATTWTQDRQQKQETGDSVILVHVMWSQPLIFCVGALHFGHGFVFVSRNFTDFFS